MPRRLRRVARPASAGAAFASLLAAGALIAACSSSVAGTGSLARTPAASTSTSHTSATSTRSSSPDFPTASSSTSASRTTSSSSASRSSSGSDAALKASLAQIGASWAHAYANGDEAQFCALSDPATLQEVFDQKGIASCAQLDINWDTDPDLQAQLASLTIPDPQKIVVNGAKASVSAANVQPSGLTGLGWIQESDQSWKVDASILAD